jgi:hypothetical protein
VTGPESTNAILVIYDIFGYFPQTLQGADILATSDKDHSYQVFMPDFFEGEAASISWYPPVTDEQKTQLYSWFSTRDPTMGVSKIPKILADIEAAYGKKTWAALGVSFFPPSPCPGLEQSLLLTVLSSIAGVVKSSLSRLE